MQSHPNFRKFGCHLPRRINWETLVKSREGAKRLRKFLVEWVPQWCNSGPRTEVATATFSSEQGEPLEKVGLGWCHSPWYCHFV